MKQTTCCKYHGTGGDTRKSCGGDTARGTLIISYKDGSGSRPLTITEGDLLLRALEEAADRVKDTLENPLEAEHYTGEELAKMERRVEAYQVLAANLGEALL